MLNYIGSTVSNSALHVRTMHVTVYRTVCHTVVVVRIVYSVQYTGTMYVQYYEVILLVL